MSLFVMRHGESIWNQENKYTGWVDIGLSDRGIKEAQQAGHLLANIPLTHIITSDLKRTQHTARLILENRLIDEEKVSMMVAADIKERNYGDLAGINKAELQKKFGPEQMQRWRRSYYDGPPGGENLHQVRERVAKYFDTVVRPLYEEGNNILIVAHGNSLRALFVHLGFKDEKTIEMFELATATPIEINLHDMYFQYVNEYLLEGIQIFDSRGFPTIQVQCVEKKTGKIVGKGSCPSGASCGSNEVIELRDGNPHLYKGKSVFKAIDNLARVNRELSLNQSNICQLREIDRMLNILDGTKEKSVLGGNLTTAISFCMADVAANLTGLELFDFIHRHFHAFMDSDSFHNVATPLVNVINGGKHGVTDDLKIQEFMIFPNEMYSVSKKMQIVGEVYHSLKDVLVQRYGKQAKSIGDEGGFCPPIYNPVEALQVIQDAIVVAGYIPNEDVFLALDCAASEFYIKSHGVYEIEKGRFLTSDALIDYYCELMEQFPALKSIEDAFDEHDYIAWQKFTERCGDRIMIVGDDLFTSNPSLIERGLKAHWANTLLLKVNQIGTISEAVESARLMMMENHHVIVSHRSGETNHAYIIDLAVGIGAKYVKIGSPCRGERVAKFNRLIEIDGLQKSR